MLAGLQLTAGNTAVQRLVAGGAGPKPEPKSPGDKDREEGEERKDPCSASVQCRLEVVEEGADPPRPGREVVVQRAAALTFPLTTSEGRSNTDPATTAASDPTFTGSVTKDDKRKRWGYRLDAVEAKGTIKFVYYTEDHYPAPTPTDDAGALSNVDSTNWKAVVKDLVKNRTKVAGNWSSYRRTQLHERYHWEGEWQKLVRAGVKKAEKKVAKLAATFADAATEADAQKVLEPSATTLFTGVMADVRKRWNAMGDSPGDPPYRAGAPGSDALAARVRSHAKSQKWK